MTANRLAPQTATSKDEKLDANPVISTAESKAKNCHIVGVTAKNSSATHLYFKKVLVDDQWEWAVAGIDLHKILSDAEDMPYPPKAAKELSKVSEIPIYFAHTYLTIPMTVNDIRLLLDIVISKSRPAIRANASVLKKLLINHDAKSNHTTWTANVQDAKLEHINLPHPILWLQNSIISPKDELDREFKPKPEHKRKKAKIEMSAAPPTSINATSASPTMSTRSLSQISSTHNRLAIDLGLSSLSQRDDHFFEPETSTMLTPRAASPGLSNHGFFPSVIPMQLESAEARGSSFTIDLKNSDDAMDHSSDLSNGHEKNEQQLKSFLEQSLHSVSDKQTDGLCFFAFGDPSKRNHNLLESDCLEVTQQPAI